jgi:hypothetical protein
VLLVIRDEMLCAGHDADALHAHDRLESTFAIEVRVRPEAKYGLRSNPVQGDISFTSPKRAQLWDSSSTSIA